MKSDMAKKLYKTAGTLYLLKELMEDEAFRVYTSDKELHEAYLVGANKVMETITQLEYIQEVCERETCDD